LGRSYFAAKLFKQIPNSMGKKLSLLIFCLLGVSPSIFADRHPKDTVNSMTPQHMGSMVIINPGTINQLLAVDAMQTPGIKQFGPQSQLNAKRFWLTDFGGTQKIGWGIVVPKAGAYHVVLLTNAHKGTAIKLTSEFNNATIATPIEGWQRTPPEVILQLSAGPSVLYMQVADSSRIDIKSVELSNVAEEARIAKRIRAFKGDATWIKEAGYGIMFQAGGWSYPRQGGKQPWPAFAENINVKALVQKVRRMGGKYIVWSATWSDYLFPAPMKTISAVMPGRVSKRDLIGDLIRECRRYDIRVMLYYHMGHDHKDVLLAKGWKDSTMQTYASRQRWLDWETNLFTEIGTRYGKGLDAIFLDDGCVWYPADFEKLGAALKSGNPKRLVCYNPWISPSLTPFQDFYCGEGFDGGNTPYKLKDGIIAEGPQNGLQLFGNFVFDGSNWGINKPNTVINAPKNWTVARLVRMTKKLEKEQYSVAIDLLMYEDGSISKTSYTMLKKAAIQLKRGYWASHIKHIALK